MSTISNPRFFSSFAQKSGASLSNPLDAPARVDARAHGMRVAAAPTPQTPPFGGIRRLARRIGIRRLAFSPKFGNGFASVEKWTKFCAINQNRHPIWRQKPRFSGVFPPILRFFERLGVHFYEKYCINIQNFENYQFVLPRATPSLYRLKAINRGFYRLRGAKKPPPTGKSPSAAGVYDV